MKRHQEGTCPCLSSQLCPSVFGNLVVAQQTYAEVKEAALFLRREERAAPRGTATRRRQLVMLARRSSLEYPGGAPRHEYQRTLSAEVIREHPARGSSAEEEDEEEQPAEEDVWSARVEREFLRGRPPQLSRHRSSPSACEGRGDEDDGRRRRRVSQLVDELLLDIYGRRCGRRTSSAGSSAVESDCWSASAASSWCWRTEGYRPGQDAAQRAAVSAKSVPQLRAMLATLRLDVQMAGARLVRQLKRRDRLKARQAIQNSVVTAYLQAVSEKRSEDAKLRFSVVPYPGDSGFTQWHDAMKMVTRLPGGIPGEFRRRLWLTLAERHLQERGVDWAKTQRFCFNEWTNPDDDELGVQIVKDLHRTGCSLFCGAAAEENQALLKRVLLAYARWNKAVGYCQGFNMLAALVLQVVDRSETDAVKVMIYLIEGVLPESYFANNLRGLSVDMAVFRDLLRLRLPALSRHLELLQQEAGDSATGTSYEPPLTNVFTMQWFLTLFSNCLPQATVLRVWDLIFLEGNEVLLRTALAIWDGLADRIMAVESADEFYSIMGVLTREMLEFGLMDANHLVKTIVTIAPFPFPELPDLRDKYLYNITPWTQTVSTAARRGLRLFYSDDDDDTDEDDEKIAVATAYGISTVFRSPRRKDSVHRAPSPTTTSLSTLSYGCVAPDRDRLALDISALKQQYAKLRERQRQAHIILTAACTRQSMGPSAPTPVAMNHLLLGKSALLSVRGRRMGPLPGAVPPLRPTQQGRLLTATSRALHPERRPHPGETLHWKDAARRRQKKAADDSADVPTQGAADVTEREVSETHEDGSAHDSSDNASSSSSSSSTSTELCDEPDRLSDFDSEEPTSISDASSYVPPSDNLLKIPSPSTDISSSPSPELCPSAAAFRSHPSLTDGSTGTIIVKIESEETVACKRDKVVPSQTVVIPRLELPSQETDYSATTSVISSPSESQEHITSTNEEASIPPVSINDADTLYEELSPTQGQVNVDNDRTTVDAEKRHLIYRKSTRDLTNIMNEISVASEVVVDALEEETSASDHYVNTSRDFRSDTLFPHKHYDEDLITPDEKSGYICKSEMYSFHSLSSGKPYFTDLNNHANEEQEISKRHVTSITSTSNTAEEFRVTDGYHSGSDSFLSSPSESVKVKEIENRESGDIHGYESSPSVDTSIANERVCEELKCQSIPCDERVEESSEEAVQSVVDQGMRTHVPVTLVIQSNSAENLSEVLGVPEELSPSNIGRRKSERALKIIQENFEILQRITQCHGRHSDRQLESKFSCSKDGDVCDDEKSSSADQSINDLSSVLVRDKISVSASPQSEKPDDKDSFETVSAAKRSNFLVSQPEKFEFLHSPYGTKCQTQLKAEIPEHIDDRSKLPEDFVFNHSNIRNQEKSIILTEGDNFEKRKTQTSLNLRNLSTEMILGEIHMDMLFKHTNDKEAVNNKIHDDRSFKSKSKSFSQKSDVILDRGDPTERNFEDHYSVSSEENTRHSHSPADYCATSYPDYLTISGETKLNGKQTTSYAVKRSGDKRRSTIHSFDSNDRDALRLFNTSFLEKPVTNAVSDKCQDDIILEKCVALADNDGLPYASYDGALEQSVQAKNTSTSGTGIQNTRVNLHGFLSQDDDIKETLKKDVEGKSSYCPTKPESYSFHSCTQYSPESYQGDSILRDKTSASENFDTILLGSREATEQSHDQVDSSSTNALESFRSSQEFAAKKSKLTLTLRTREEASKLLPTGQASTELALSRESSPCTTSSRTLTDGISSESADTKSSESLFKSEKGSADCISPAAAHGTQKPSVKLFSYNSRSGQLKSSPSSPVKGKDIISSLTSIRSTVLSSPTQNCKKYDPFPPRASLRQPKEIGIKLGLYSATPEADKKNSSKKP